MTVALQKIDHSMFDDIYREFLVDDDPDLKQEDWKPLFTCRPETGQNHGGYALIDENRIVGILGMIFSTRRIDGADKKFCNLHTWMVNPSHRGNSLLLMRPALRLTDHTITDFTPTDPVRDIARKLGFQDLNAALRVLLPLRYLRQKAPMDDCRLTADTAEILQRLGDHESKLCRDHSQRVFGHVLVSHRGQDCYIIYSRVTRWALTYCHVHYISDAELFARCDAAIRSHILKTNKARFIVLNERQTLRIKLPLSFRFPFTNGQLYRPSDVSPNHIDSLYSDVSLLSLSTITDLSHAVMQRLRLPSLALIRSKASPKKLSA